MKIFRYDKNKHFPIRELSVAMGNFDGLHLGHKSVIELARNKSQAGRFGVLTFDPHPREFFFSTNATLPTHVQYYKTTNPRKS